MRSKHPAAGCTAVQRRAFEAIAINQRDGFHPRTIKALLDNGLIFRGDDRIVGHDRFGAVIVSDYYVPIPVHIQWCRWASEQGDPPA